MTEEALADGIRGVLARRMSIRRRGRLLIEAGYDAAVWTAGLLVAAQAAGALTGRLAFGTTR